MAFFLFILLNATLFIRPVEAFGITELQNAYLFLILPCMILAMDDIFACVLGRPLDSQPVTLCVFGLLLVVPLAFVGKMDLNDPVRSATAFVKVVIYFLLLIGLVKSGRRLNIFLGCILFFFMILAGAGFCIITR